TGFTVNRARRPLRRTRRSVAFEVASMSYAPKRAFCLPPSTRRPVSCAEWAQGPRSRSAPRDSGELIMPREAKGELRKLAEGWKARVTIQGKDRLGLALPFTHAQETEAEERCWLLAGMARRLRKAGQLEDAPALLKMAAIAQYGARLKGVLD